MFGSKYVKCIIGSWEHVGYLTSENVVLPDAAPADGSSSVPRIQKGTWMMAKTDDELKMQLASGSVGPAIGFTTQDITLNGQTDIYAFKDRLIGKQDLPVKKGRAVTLRKVNIGGEVEFEGAGAAGPGNLVVTTGTGAIASDTFANDNYTYLAPHKGSVRVAQSGDWANMLLLRSDQTPEIAGNVRIRVRIISPQLVA